MKKINCLIVDDEPIARDIIQSYVDRTPQLTLLKSCRNSTEAYDALCEHPIDLLFLDIHMPVISGTDFLRSLREPPLVIFTTAYSNYAVEGFELNSVDYLLKPITFERFCQAIKKAEERLTYGSFVSAELPVDYIFIKQDARLVKMNLADLFFVRAERDFCSLYLQSGKRLLISMHLKLIEDLLPAKQFMRIHRSYIINLDKIDVVKGNVIEAGEHEIPIGTSYRETFIQRIKAV